MLQRVAALSSGSDCRNARGRWTSIAGFLSSWQSIGNGSPSIPCVWFEFDDVSAGTDAILRPSFCVCLDSSYLERSRKPPLRQDTKALLEHAGRLLNQLSVADVADHIRVLSDCFRAIPEEGRIVHLSAMLGRSPAVTKLYLAVPKESSHAFARRLPFEEAKAEIADRIDYYSRYADRFVFLDLTVDASLASRVGIAFPTFEFGQQRRLEEVLEAASRAGSCTAAEVAALRSWEGSSRVVYTGESWPTRIARWLDIKIVATPGTPDCPKFYFGFMPHFSLF